MTPVASYVDVLLQEIEAVSSRCLPKGVVMSRLHLGGGTPTLLSAALMEHLLAQLHRHFTRSAGFEFSVEIDPTEAHPDVLQSLARAAMTRASVGVQDFDPKVQKAIGREQSFDLTQDVINTLRANGVRSLNIDLLYGLPFQTAEGLIKSLDRVISLRPDRLALYGYAHVPHFSKRQVMIPDDALPNPEQRFVMAELAKERLTSMGYQAVGIDHFALPHDSLGAAAKAGRMTRNFQGYTDDDCDTLIGFGASAISRFPQGYTQNAVSTSCYLKDTQANGLSGHRGIELTPDSRFIAAVINAIMCNGGIEHPHLAKQFPSKAEHLSGMIGQLVRHFPDLVIRTRTGLAIKPEFATAARLIAAHIDQGCQDVDMHSFAV